MRIKQLGYQGIERDSAELLTLTQRHNLPGWNVKAMGAVGDGTTDDSTVIQNAINAARDASQGIVYIPHGRYYISTTIELYEGTRLIGGGYNTQPGDASPAYNSTLLDYDGAGTALTVNGIWNGGSGSTLRRYIELNNLNVRCSHASTSRCFDATFMTSFLIERCYFHGARTQGLWFENCYNGTIKDSRIRMASTTGSCLTMTIDSGDDVFSGQLSVEGTNMWYGNIGASIEAPANVMAQLVFTRCHFDQNDTYGVYIGNTGSPRSLTFNGCHFEGSGSVGLFTDANASQMNAVVEGCFWNLGSGAYCVDHRGGEISFRGNHMRGLAPGDRANGFRIYGDRIRIEDTGFLNMTTCYQLESGCDEVYIGRASYATVTNRIVDNGVVDLYVEGTSWFESVVFDLSAASAAFVVFTAPASLWIHHAYITYTEATSADAGVALQLGIVGNDTKFLTFTSEVSKAKDSVTEVTSYNNRFVAKGEDVRAKCVGGKTGTGEAKIVFMMSEIQLW